MRPNPPKQHQPVLSIGPDTFLIRELTEEGGPVELYINSMVVAGREPVLIDTGTGGNRDGWLRDAFGLVEPADVRWVVITHDDLDHVGSLAEVLRSCPDATVVASWLAIGRLRRELDLPLERTRWVRDGDTLDVGDRSLVFVRPPLYDSPSSTGVYDPRTATYWAVDCFGLPVPAPVDDARDLDEAAFEEGTGRWARTIAPWHTMLDRDRFDESLARVAGLGVATIANAHGPVLRGERIARAIEVTRAVPRMPPLELPGQPDLEALLLTRAGG